MVKQPYILYIEDDRSLIEYVTKSLSVLGYKVLGVTSGEQGLAVMHEHQPDLLLLDLMMPDMNGWDVYRRMKDNLVLTDIPVIVLSATIPEQDGVIIDDLPPVNHYLVKPFEITHLVEAIEQAVEGNYLPF
jgi:CheY-like chemotaxis protein